MLLCFSLRPARTNFLALQDPMHHLLLVVLSIILNMIDTWQMHLDDISGAYFDFGNHTEKVSKVHAWKFYYTMVYNSLIDNKGELHIYCSSLDDIFKPTSPLLL